MPFACTKYPVKANTARRQEWTVSLEVDGFRRLTVTWDPTFEARGRGVALTRDAAVLDLSVPQEAVCCLVALAPKVCFGKAERVEVCRGAEINRKSVSEAMCGYCWKGCERFDAAQLLTANRWVQLVR